MVLIETRVKIGRYSHDFKQGNKLIRFYDITQRDILFSVIHRLRFDILEAKVRRLL